MKYNKNGIAVPETNKQQKILDYHKYSHLDVCGDNISVDGCYILALLQRAGKEVDVEINLDYGDIITDGIYNLIPSNEEIFDAFYSLKGKRRGICRGTIPDKLHLVVRKDDENVVDVQGVSKYDTLKILNHTPRISLV